jgi:hypothetical protein
MDKALQGEGVPVIVNGRRQMQREARLVGYSRASSPGHNQSQKQSERQQCCSFLQKGPTHIALFQDSIPFHPETHN